MAKRKTKKAVAGLSVFVAGVAAAAAAGTYYLYGPKGTKHMKQVRGWMLKAKGEILEEAERLKKIDKKKYNQLINKMIKKYKKVKSIDNRDIEKLGRELKSHWNMIEMEAMKGLKKGKSAVRRAVKKTAKKSPSRKTTKKVLRKRKPTSRRRKR